MPDLLTRFFRPESLQRACTCYKRMQMYVDTLSTALAITLRNPFLAVFTRSRGDMALAGLC